MLQALRSLVAGSVRSRFARNVGMLAVGAAAGQGVIVLASPVLARLYDPHEFGAFAVYTSVMFAVVSCATLRYDLAVLLPRDDEEAWTVLVLALHVVVAVTVLSALLGFLAGGSLARWTDARGLESLLVVLPLSVLGAGVFQALSAWSARRQTFPVAARTHVSQNVVRVTVQTLLGLAGAGPGGLVAGDAVGRLAGGTAIAAGLRARGVLLRRRPAVGEILAAARRYRGFPLLSSWGSLLNQVGIHLPAVLLAGLYGAEVSGLYALGHRVINLPVALVGQSLAQVYASHASGLAEDGQRMRRLFFRSAAVLLALGIVPFGLLGLAGPQLFALVFGSRWTEAGSYVQILSVMYLCQFVVTPLSQTLNLLERQGVQVLWDAARVAVVVLTLVLSARAGLPPRAALGIYAFSMAGTLVALFALSSAGLARHAGTSEATAP